MTKKKSALINESVARRWGKLANMPSLTENWLETLNEEDPAEEEAEAMDDMEKAALGDDPEAEMDYAEGDLERADDAEAGDLAGVLETDEAQALVAGIASQVADMLGVDVDIETDGEAEEVEDVVDMDVEIEEPAMGDDPAMAMHPRNRDDELEEDLHERGMKKGDQSKTRADYEGEKDKDPKADKKAREKYDKKHKGSGARMGDQSKSKADFEESLDLEVIDDEALTEAVLKRVVERLLNRK